jgi:hypothetical protein
MTGCSVSFQDTAESTEETNPNESEIESNLKVTASWIKAMDQEAMGS